MSIAEIKKYLETNRLIFGTERSLHEMKLGNVEKIYISKNCPQPVREDVQHYATLSNTPVVFLEEENTEVGGICKKPFAISVLSLRKQ